MIKLSIGLIGKRLRVVCTDGSVFEGLCFGYDQSFNNEPPMDSISVEQILAVMSFLSMR